MKFLRNLIVALFVLAGIAWFVVSPASQINPSQRIAQADSQHFSDSLGQMTSNIQFSDQGLTSQMELDQQAFNGLLKAAFTNQNSAELLEGSYQLEAGRIQAKIPYRILGAIQSQIELDLRLGIQDQHLVLTVSSARLGRIPLPDSMVEQVLQEQKKQNSNLQISGKTVQIPLPQEAFAVKDVKVQAGKVVVGLQVEQNDLLNLGLATLANQLV